MAIQSQKNSVLGEILDLIALKW